MDAATEKSPELSRTHSPSSSTSPTEIGSDRSATSTDSTPQILRYQIASSNALEELLLATRRHAKLRAALLRILPAQRNRAESERVEKHAALLAQARTARDNAYRLAVPTPAQIVEARGCAARRLREDRRAGRCLCALCAEADPIKEAADIAGLHVVRLVGGCYKVDTHSITVLISDRFDGYVVTERIGSGRSRCAGKYRRVENAVLCAIRCCGSPCRAIEADRVVMDLGDELSAMERHDLTQVAQREDLPPIRVDHISRKLFETGALKEDQPGAVFAKAELTVLGRYVQRLYPCRCESCRDRKVDVLGKKVSQLAGAQ